MSQIITQYFQADHDRLDLLFSQYKQLKTTDFSAATLYLQQFIIDLKHHIQWEERFLFPLYEQITGMRQGPTQIMCHEHIEIQNLLEALTTLTKEQDSDPLIRQLELVLSNHNHKEEQVLYPNLDRAANEQQKSQMMLEMAQFNNKI